VATEASKQAPTFIHLAAGYNSGMDKQTELKKIEAAMAANARCRFAIRANLVFGEANINCQVRLLAKRRAANEDRERRPFVGRGENC